MRFQIISILAGMVFVLASHPALAKDECPEGYVSFVNSETYQSVCLPVDVEKTQTPEANAKAQAEDSRAEEESEQAMVHIGDA